VTPQDLQTVRAVLLWAGVQPREHAAHLACDFGAGLHSIDKRIGYADHARALANYRAIYRTLPGAWKGAR